MTYEEALHWLGETKARGIRPGLARISHLLDLLGNPEDGLRIVHVAGTNGKGSTCAFLEAVLLEAGHATGMFTSPWLTDPCEMFRINGEPVSHEVFADLAGIVAGASEGMAGEPGLPTEYEIYAAMAFLLFHRRACSAVILETCMGGRFDTTNAYKGPNTAVLTKISLDHVAFLGETLPAIAWHKAGIIRGGSGVASWPQQDGAALVIEQASQEAGASLSVLNLQDVRVEGVDEKGTTFSIAGFGRFHTVLPGAHQAGNAALALMALKIMFRSEEITEPLPCQPSIPDMIIGKALHIPRQEPVTGLPSGAMFAGIGKARWPCRFEVFAGRPPIVLDGAHNPDGIASFVDTYRRVYQDKKASIIFGAMKDKDVAGMMELLFPIADRFILIQPDSPRAMPLQDLHAIASRGCCAVVKSDTMEAALETGLADTPAEGVLAAVGSIFFMGRLKRIILDGWRTA
jgi:dihydrofolate synthase / folylpolyglutamate synthase